MTSKDPTDKSSELLKRLFHAYLSPYVMKMVAATLCMAITAGATAGNAWVMQPMLDSIFVEKNNTMLLVIPFIILALGIIRGFSTYGYSVIIKRTTQRIIMAMQMDLYKHLIHTDIALHDAYSSGNLISRFSNEMHIIRSNLIRVMAGVAKELLTLIFLVGVMFYQSPFLATLVMFAFPLSVPFIVRLGKRMRKVTRVTQEHLGELNGHLEDSFHGVRLIKSHCNEEHETSRTQQVIKRISGLYFKSAQIESLVSPFVEILSAFTIAFVVWYSGRQVISGETTPGAFFSFMAALMMAYQPAKKLSKLNARLQEFLAVTQRFFIMLDTPAAITEKPDALPLTHVKGEIHFQNVSFNYGNIAALRNISISVKAGSRVALVGPSGGGKTTLMTLLLRFYDPNSGTITIDGTDITSVTLSSLRQQIALVNQDTTLFNDTILNNIRYSKLDATDDEVKKAATLAAAHDFIADMPDRYNSIVGQHGARLSGGQKQRIAIARALLRNAPILLLDEATSALDAQSEQHVQDALDTLMKGRTTIVIAHRLSTIVHSDYIYVMDNGTVVEEGSHHELLKQDGLYSSLYHQQFGLQKPQHQSSD